MARKETAGVKNKTNLQKNIVTMNQNMVSLGAEIQSLSNNIKALMDGNSEGPFWNGNKAMKFYKKALSNLTADIKDYKSAYKYLNNLAIKYENAVKKDR